MNSDMLRVEPDHTKNASPAIPGTPFISPGSVSTSGADIETRGEGLQEPLAVWVYHQGQRYRLDLSLDAAMLERFRQGERGFQASTEWLVSLQEGESSREETETINFLPTIVKNIFPEAERRFKGYEKVVQEVCSLAEKEAQAHKISLLKIEVRPAWSHEYDERTGVVIDVEIKATVEKRFSYWDAVCERLDQLADSLPPQERRFLHDEISFVVTQV